MPLNNISPEEKLLKLIRENKEEEDKAIDVIARRHKMPTKQSLLRLLHFVRNDSCGIFQHSHIKGFFHHGTRPILICVIILLFYFIQYEFRPDTKPAGVIDIAVNKVNTEKENAVEASINLKPYSYYEQAIGNKSLFSQIIDKSMPVSKANTEKIDEMCKPYRIKGIIMGERPEAVIEDIQSQRTFTVTIGDTIGKLTVMDITEGRVTLGYEEETCNIPF